MKVRPLFTCKACHRVHYQRVGKQYTISDALPLGDFKIHRSLTDAWIEFPETLHLDPIRVRICACKPIPKLENDH